MKQVNQIFTDKTQGQNHSMILSVTFFLFSHSVNWLSMTSSYDFSYSFWIVDYDRSSVFISNKIAGVARLLEDSDKQRF